MEAESLKAGIRLDDGELDNAAGGIIGPGPDQYEEKTVLAGSTEAIGLGKGICPNINIVFMGHPQLTSDDGNRYDCPICGIRWIIQ